MTFPEIATRRGSDEWDTYFDLLVDAGPDMDKLLMFGGQYTRSTSRTWCATRCSCSRSIP